MVNTQDVATLFRHLNALVGGLFLLAALGLVGTRQVLACLRLFMLQSALLAASALIQAIAFGSGHLLAVALLALGTRALLIPWLLTRTVRGEVFTRREISQALGVPTSLLVAAALVLVAYFVSAPLLLAAGGGFEATNLPLGLAGLLLGAYAIAVRGEAVPQLLGILAAENGAFFAATAIAGDLPLIVEVAVSVDVLMIAAVLGLLTRRIHDRTGSTAVGDMDALGKE